ncbi:MAG: pyruvate formate lyase family protein, partial [Candidatus Hodarchaeota archaeon]
MQDVITCSKEGPSERILRLRTRYQDEITTISIQRAQHFTEKWFETEKEDLPLGKRVALSMKNVYEHMDHHVDPDDRIAGYWTESFLGMPLDVERGVFNNVVKTELKKSNFIKFKIGSSLKTFGYLLKKGQLGNFLKNVKIMKSMGAMPINMSLQTMDEREINPYTIAPGERKILLEEILPRWKNKTIMDKLDAEIKKSDLIPGSILDFTMALPANTSKQTLMVSPCSTIARYQGHLINDFETVLNDGLLEMKKKVDNEKKKTTKKDDLDFLESVKIALEGIIIYAERLAESIERKMENENDPERKEILSRMLENCRRVPLHPPETFYQAVQSAWTVKVALELAHPVNLQCFGRMDQLLFPYYKKDIDQGLITPGEARELLEELLLKLMSLNIRPESNTLANFYHRYLGSTPVTIGGLKPDGTDGTNELTYLIIEAAQNARAVTNISLRVTGDTPDDALLVAADALYNGSSNISFFNDEIAVEAMKRFGFSTEDARDYAVMGCVELVSQGKTGGMSANAMLLCRLLDMTMRNGDALTMIGKIKGAGLKTGDPASFK